MRVSSKVLPLSMGSPSELFYFTDTSITVRFCFVNTFFEEPGVNPKGNFIVFLVRL